METSSVARAVLGAVVLTVMAVAVASVPAGASHVRPRTPRSSEPMLLSRAGTTDVVYVFGESNCAESRCARLYRSNIGATSFRRVTPPPAKLEPGAFLDSTLEKLVFANPEDGFALIADGNFGATLYATSNGARSWRMAASVDKGEMTLFVSSSQVYLSIVDCKPRTMDCTQWVTERSTLAAQRWTTMPQLWRTGRRSDEFYGPSLAAAGDTVWELETGPQIRLWRSFNDGRTSRARREPALASVAGCTFTTTSGTSMWAECPTGMQVAFLHSTDGGIHWTHVDQTQFMGTGGGAFDPVSSTVAYLDYGQDNGATNLFRLTDGGRHASGVANVTCASVPSMVFANSTQGLMLCNLDYTSIQLRRTDDGGVSWHSVDLPTE